MYLGDLAVTYQERLARVQEVSSWLATLGPELLQHLLESNQNVRGDVGALLYLFETPESTLL